MTATPGAAGEAGKITGSMRNLIVLVALACALAGTAAFAQSDATTDPREFTEAGRKAYGESLRSARALLTDKDYAGAIAILDKLVAERPREPQARFLKGIALSDSGKVDDAIATFRSIVNEYPELPEPHNNLAVLYASKGEYELARNELETAVAVAPDYVVAYENLGDIYARLAVLNYEKAIARDNRNRSAPVKLKSVREALAPPSATTPPVIAPPAASAAPAAPAAAAN